MHPLHDQGALQTLFLNRKKYKTALKTKMNYQCGVYFYVANLIQDLK